MPSHSEPIGQPHILLVDDDVSLCELMKDFFAENGFQLDAVHDGPAGLARALDGRHEVVILDVMLPFLDGFEVLAQLRRRSMLPVIMLTARTDQADRIAGLNAGADDYLPKPFGPEELLARIRAIMRRAAPRPVESESLEIANLSISTRTREVRLAGKDLGLTSTEFDILDLLARSMGRIVSRDELSAVLHQRVASPFDRSIDVHMSHLRKKIDGAGLTIRAVRCVGYLLRAGTEDEL